MKDAGTSEANLERKWGIGEAAAAWGPVAYLTMGYFNQQREPEEVAATWLQVSYLGWGHSQAAVVDWGTEDMERWELSKEAKPHPNKLGAEQSYNPSGEVKHTEETRGKNWS